MENSNKYTIESLKEINQHFSYDYEITQFEVDRANYLIKKVEQRFKQNVPHEGDKVEYTSKHGDYYPSALIERIRENLISICENPQTPFIIEGTQDVYCTISGGGFTELDTELFQWKGTVNNLFKDWGKRGACAGRAFYFFAKVNLWECIHPEPLYGDFTTKDWRKLHLNKHPDTHREKSGYLYSGDGFAFRDEKEFQKFLKTNNATLFDGYWENSFVVFTKKNRVR